MAVHKYGIIVRLGYRVERRRDVPGFSALPFSHKIKPWLAAILLSSTAAAADDWIGRVVAVTDGDTLTIQHYGDWVSVRLDEIDAPELRQPYGGQSRKSLSGLCLGRYADVQEKGQDKYGRILARVTCTGTDANAEQIRRGYAWFYTRYGRDPALPDLESVARGRRAGLWVDPTPIPPWDFRHENPDAGNVPRPRAGAGFHAGSCERKKTCGEMESCDEAKFYLNRCGLTRLDRNQDGVPCESLCR